MQTFINKYFYYLFVFSLIFVILLYHVIGFKFTDEISAAVLFGLFFYAVIKTPDWKFNKVFLFTLFVFFFYTCYSLWIGSNTKKGIFSDLIVQMKPYLGFFCVYQLKPLFEEKQKKLLKEISLLSWFIFLLPLGLISLVKEKIFFTVMGHPIYYGIAVTLVSICYLYCSDFSWRSRITFLLLLLLGILCGRSKFYGFYAMSFFIIIFFSNIKQFKFNVRNSLLIACMFVVILFVARDKIVFYFSSVIMENSAMDEDMIARSMLYLTFPNILRDYFPFGSGLASFATFHSGLYYSDIYMEYGLDSVWGLSKSAPSFVSDAFYPSLAQFGVVGVILYISFWVYLLRKTFIYYKNHPNPRLQYVFVVILIIGFLAIEGTTVTTFTAQGGFFVMMLLGVILFNMNLELKNHENPAN